MPRREVKSPATIGAWSEERNGAVSLTGLGMKALRTLDPEAAHGWALRALAAGLGPRARGAPDPMLAVELWGRRIANPVGVAAGFDKNAVAPDAILAMGAGFVEIGAVTPRPQQGNPRPRLFRLTQDRAVINRMGFNNQGAEAIARRLRARGGRPGLVGANIGANKDSADRIADYVAALGALWGLCGFYTVNVSSPNTEKLRDLQGRAALVALLGRVLAERDRLIAAQGGGAPVLLKIAPDLTEPEIADVAAAALETGVDGIIATNTTIARPEGLRSPHRGEAGGLSGAPLFERSTQALRQLRRATEGRLPLIGVGGVDSARTAYAKIRAGASLVQLYSAMVFQGPGLPARIAAELPALLRADGFETLSQAVGADA